MILAIDRQAVLYFYESEAQAVGDLEAIDVENNEYKFCDETGQSLIAEITKPVTRFRGGGFRLVPTGNTTPNLPICFVEKAKELGKTCLGVNSLDALKQLLRGSA